jgi:hypothetical protein
MMFPSPSRNSRQASSYLPTRSRKCLPSLETLEGRQLMSLGAEFLAPVNTKVQSDQFSSANASSSNGSSVAVWVDTFNPADHDIRAQRFNAAGFKTGPEIVVSSDGRNEFTPAVAMDRLGNFVVTWTQALSGGDFNVIAQRFNAAGTRVGGVVPVGVGTFKEYSPSVAMDARGDFVVAYTRDTNNINPDVFAKRYDVNNTLTAVTAVAVSTFAESNASVAMSPDGRFDVAWEQTISTHDHDIYLTRFNASGGALGSVAVAVSSDLDRRPSVSMDNSANAVVAWQQQGGVSPSIKARRISAGGAAGSPITIAVAGQTLSDTKVALKQGGGGFVVVYNSLDGAGNVKVAEVSSSGTVTTFNVNGRGDPAVSINGFGDYLVTYTSSDGVPGGLNIRGRRGHLS